MKKTLDVRPFRSKQWEGWRLEKTNNLWEKCCVFSWRGELFLFNYFIGWGRRGPLFVAAICTQQWHLNCPRPFETFERIRPVWRGFLVRGGTLGKGWCNWMNANFQHVSSYGLNPQNMWNPKKGVAVLDNPDRFELFHIPMQLEKNELQDDKRPIQWPADFWRSSGESLFPTEFLRTCRACGSSVFVHAES